ncbi:MAG: flap endonuclease-1 [Candidatus Kariarchaeaceae archaeon]|jgi:flap endonuclease-1
MGVKKLSDIFSKSSIEINIDKTLADYNGKYLAFDAFNVLFQFMASIRDDTGQSLVDQEGNVTSHLIGILTRNSNLIQQGITPVYVFDGKSHELKSVVQKERRSKREVAKREYDKALEEGDLTRAKKFASRVNYLNDTMIEDAKKLLTLMGIPVVQAPGEGEAQAAQLALEGKVYATASQDYDALLFGTPIMVRNVNITGRRSLPGGSGFKVINPIEIELSLLLKGLDLTREQLIDVGILLGSDFNPDGVAGIGPKTAYSLMKKHGSFIETEKNDKRVKDAEIPYEEIRDIFTQPNVITGLELDKSMSFDGEKVLSFLVDQKNFSEGRYTNIIRKTEKVLQDKQKQTALDDFF